MRGQGADESEGVRWAVFQGMLLRDLRSGEGDGDGDGATVESAAPGLQYGSEILRCGAAGATTRRLITQHQSSHMLDMECDFESGSSLIAGCGTALKIAMQ